MNIVLTKAKPSKRYNKIHAVSVWLIEFENGNEYPNREIGLNTLGKPIMIMPWKKNYGYWTDNNLLLKDFKSEFDAIDISEEEFEKHWALFEEESSNLLAHGELI